MAGWKDLTDEELERARKRFELREKEFGALITRDRSDYETIMREIDKRVQQKREPMVTSGFIPFPANSTLAFSAAPFSAPGVQQCEFCGEWVDARFMFDHATQHAREFAQNVQPTQQEDIDVAVERPRKLRL